MFKKPATVKTTSPLRSSDLRKLREELAATFSLPLALAKRILAGAFPSPPRSAAVLSGRDELRADAR